MTVLPWGTPDAIGRLTIPQLACLTSERPDNRRGPCKTPEEFFAALAEQERAESAWSE